MIIQITGLYFIILNMIIYKKLVCILFFKHDNFNKSPEWGFVDVFSKNPHYGLNVWLMGILGKNPMIPIDGVPNSMWILGITPFSSHALHLTCLYIMNIRKSITLFKWMYLYDKSICFKYYRNTNNMLTNTCIL